MNKSKKYYYLFFYLLMFSIISFQSCKNNNTLFESLPATKTNIQFVNKLEQKKLFNILYYLYYYNGAGVATGDVNNDGLEDIYFAANSKGNNKLYINKGNFQFEDITVKANVAGTSDWCTGVTMADVNADGFLDIYVSTVSGRYGLNGHNELFINNKNNTFTESAEAFGLNTSCFTTQTAFFDYDHDGDLDCYMLNQSHHPHSNIVDTINRRTYDTLSGDRLYRNDVNTPSKKFVEVTKQSGIYQSSLGYGLGLGIADINNDGWDDIYVGNDFHENDYYYVNNKNGTFTESGAKHFGHYSRFSMGNDIADCNNDGQLDIITVDMLPADEKILKSYGSDENPDTYKVKLELRGYQNQYSKNCLQINNGNGVSFSETSLQSGVAATDWSWCPLFADFDNDGNKDLFITSGIVKRPVDLDFIRFVSKQQMKGIDSTDKFDAETIAAMPDGSSHPFLFKGNGASAFEDVSQTWGTQNLKGFTNGASFADLDNDGNIDVVINSLNSPAIILKNNASKKNYLSINCKSDSLSKTPIGAKVYVFAGGKIQYQQLMPTRGFMSSSTTQLHFGLDTLKKVDSLLVVWPNQKYERILNPAINQTITLHQQATLNNFAYNDFFAPTKELFKDISAQINCKWTHKENDFLDYNVQYLIPHSQSTRGPKLAVADVNKDGLDDFYICGAKFQAGALMIQQKDGTFIQSDTALFNQFSICEDVDAVFFDANGDTFPDLLVISGGNEKPVSPISFFDRLYLNDGKGNFLKEKNPMAGVFENKSCVAISDVDHDGDIDIFVGGLCHELKYGLPVNSYLFLNDGNANFTRTTDNIIPLSKIGMVTAALFADVDNDGWKDLIVTGEWMPLKIYKNNKGKFSEMHIPSSTGLWQSLYATDINRDGYVDLLAGNWGLNNKFASGKNGPLKLYIKDFDNNGTIEQILAYTIDGKEYPFLAKDELERALPVLKKAYLKYDEVAGKTIQYILYDLFKDYTELKAEVLASSCFINDGKGNFTRIDLPKKLQYAPISNFISDDVNNGNFLALGNFYGVIPYEGRYDALFPTLFNFNKNKKELETTAVLQEISGETRDSKWINYVNGKKVLIIAKNNAPLVFLQKEK